MTREIPKATPHEMIARASRWAELQHADQFYGDRPYIEHCREVAGLLRNLQDTPWETVAAALMHDIVEDTETTLSDIETFFGKEVADIVGFVTKDESLSYEENIARIANSGNLGAIKVKLADNEANRKGDKSHMTKARRERLNTKYAKAHKVLEDAYRKELAK